MFFLYNGSDMSNFQTPLEICKYMVSLVPNGCKTILEPTPGKGNIVRDLINYDVTDPEDFFQLDPSIFDCVVYFFLFFYLIK